MAEGLLWLDKTRPVLLLLFERMNDFDEGVQEWHDRHLELVQRSIGSSLGVEFLENSLFRPLFADLWTIRHRLCSTTSPR